MKDSARWSEYLLLWEIFQFEWWAWAYSGFENSRGSSTVSLASTIARGIVENGRTYASYGKQDYGMPIDEFEQERLDMKHREYLLLLEDKLFLAPISEHIERALDLGTGSGMSF